MVSLLVPAHDTVTVQGKRLALIGLGVAVSCHLIGWTALHFDVTFLYLIGHTEQLDVQVPVSFASTHSAIPLWLDSALVVLAENALFDFAVLSFWKSQAPQNAARGIICTN